MTDADREEYQRRVRELAAEYRAQRPRTSFAAKVRALLTGKRPVVRPLAIAPKGTRTSGPQRCQNPECSVLCLPGSGELHAHRYCGKCYGQSVPPGISRPLATETDADDGPRAA